MIDRLPDFLHLQTMMRSGEPSEIPGKNISAWAKLVVR